MSIAIRFLVPVAAHEPCRCLRTQSEPVGFFEVDDTRQRDATANSDCPTGARTGSWQPSARCRPQGELPARRVPTRHNAGEVDVIVHDGQMIEGSSNVEEGVGPTSISSHESDASIFDVP